MVNRELAPAEARRHGRSAKRRAQQSRDALQGVVAGVVPARIVDVLESVHPSSRPTVCKQPSQPHTPPSSFNAPYTAFEHGSSTDSHWFSRQNQFMSCAPTIRVPDLEM